MSVPQRFIVHHLPAPFGEASKKAHRQASFPQTLSRGQSGPDPAPAMIARSPPVASFGSAGAKVTVPARIGVAVAPADESRPRVSDPAVTVVGLDAGY
jgi:hypothetical protein